MRVWVALHQRKPDSRLSQTQIDSKQARQQFYPPDISIQIQRHNKRIQDVSKIRRGRDAAPYLSTFQSDSRNASQGRGSRVLLCRGPDFLDESRCGGIEAEASGDG